MDLGSAQNLAQLAECPIFFIQKSLHPSVHIQNTKCLLHPKQSTVKNKVNTAMRVVTDIGTVSRNFIFV